MSMCFDRNYYIIAVDFDCTLYTGKDVYPGMGEPNLKLIGFLRNRQDAGDKIILWTCRSNLNEDKNDLDLAVEWCKEFGLEFDAVNDNIQEMKDLVGDTRKIIADVYIDDKSANNLLVDEENGITPYSSLLREVFVKTNRVYKRTIEYPCLKCGNFHQMEIPTYDHARSGYKCDVCGSVSSYLLRGLRFDVIMHSEDNQMECWTTMLSKL